MALSIYNTLTRQKETFVPSTPGKAGLYVCGPTVYDYIHIGNARTFTTFDMVARWLRTTGYDVTYVRNVTDIDDKIIDRAKTSGTTFEALAKSMTTAFEEDCARLALLPPDRQPRATKYIDAMQGLISTLEKKRLAYRTDDGVYFSVRDLPGYGKLSRRNLDEMRAGERVAVGDKKKDPLDFALWKAAKPGEPSWPSPWGAGRPGWHIECSAMAASELGTPVDIHGGAVDLQFPHHENEIAQSEGAGAAPFTKLWMHGAFLNMDAEKMSKSLGQLLSPCARSSPSWIRCRAASRCASSSCAPTTAARSTTRGRRSPTRASRCAGSTPRCAKCRRPPTPRSTGRIPSASAFATRWTRTSTRPSPSPCCTSCAAR
jgi:cysteinyl-tRNA synthetase